MKLVVGLGNPGRKYQHTRHNIGFEVIAELARRWNLEGSQEQFESEIVQHLIPTSSDSEEEKLILASPLTYMNESGRSVRKFVDFYDLQMNDLLIVCDDMNLEPGRIRLRSKGSAGGQKGLQSIINHLGSEEFPRLRVGIGRPPGKMKASAYVLRHFNSTEQEIIENACQLAADGIQLWMKSGIDQAMNSLNRKQTDSE